MTTKPLPSVKISLPKLLVHTTEDDQLDLITLKGQQVVLYFYPKDDTPGCTTEGLDFKAAFESFQKVNTKVFGVSKDDLKSHHAFKCKMDFPFALISDVSGSLCEFFGVIKPKKMYGKEYIGIERSTFLFDVQGELQKEWRAVKVEGHVEQVLAEAEKIHHATHIDKR